MKPMVLTKDKIMFDFGKDYDDGFSPIPAGVYPAEIESLEWRSTISGTEYLSAMINIVGDNYANRKIFHVFNLFHAKDQVRNIAMASLKKLFKISGYDLSKLGQVDKDKLVEILYATQFSVKLDIKTDDYGEKNVIKTWLPKETASPQISTPGSDQKPPF